MEYTHRYFSPLGDITLASDGSAITGLWFVCQKYYASTLSVPHEERMLPVFECADHWLSIYFSGQAPGFTPPLRPSGTPFQKEVWEALLTIPFGCTMSYAQVAELVAARRGIPHMSLQAVGNAIGHNPISLIIPCHRVVGSDGGLTGYAGGLERKSWLLQLEGSR